MHRRLPFRRVMVVTAVAVLVAVGSAGASAWAPLRLGRPDPAAVLLILLAAGATAAVAAGGVARLVRTRADSSGPSRGSILRWALPTAAVALALTGLFGISRLDLGTREPPARAVLNDGGMEGRRLLFDDKRSPPVRVGEGAGETPPPPVLEHRTVTVALLILLGVLGGGGALAWWWWVWRGAGDEGPLPGQVDPASARRTVLRSIEAMLSDPDPNTAVIGAYASLLEGLAASGVPRRDHEGPVEHLRRALGRLRVPPEPARRLVRLFEVARFSTHTLTPEHRDAALLALREIAAGLGDGAGPGDAADLGGAAGLGDGAAGAGAAASSPGGRR